MWTITSRAYTFIFICFAIRLTHTVDIVCRGDIRQYAEVGEISTSVTWPPPFTSADTVTVVSSHNPGHVFFIGTTPVVYTAIDFAGNSQTCSFTVTVLRDDIPTIVTCPPDLWYPTDPGTDSAAAFWFTADIQDDTGPLIPVESHTSGSRFTIGVTQVTNTATDVNNNTVVCAFTVTVEDQEDPSFTGCPASASGKTLAGTRTSVTWTPPTATDNSGLPLTITSTRDPGGNFAIGDTVVQYEAIDVGGNIDRCTFTVTVAETTGPVFNNCPQPRIVSNDAGENFAIVTWTEPTANDADDVPMVTSTQNPGDSFVIGVTLVTYTATDADGYTAQCAFAITVEDTEAPTISNCPSDISTTVLPTNDPLTLSWRRPTASDNADQNVLLVSTHNPGDSFTSGQTQVSYTARDDAGNLATCIFIVDVNVVDQADTTFYNGTLGLDRIGSVNGPFTGSNDLLNDNLIQQIDTVLRTSSISPNCVGLDSITASFNSDGIAVLEYTLHIIPDVGYTVQAIEQSFEDNLMGTDGNEFTDGNRVVNQTFVIGICPDDFCMNDGVCYLDIDNFVSACQCTSEYIGSQRQSDAPLATAIIIVISLTSGIFTIVVILVIICAVLSCLSSESNDKEKALSNDVEKAKGINNNNMITRHKDVVHDDVFYPNGIQTVSQTVANGGTISGPKFPNGITQVPNGAVPISRNTASIPNGTKPVRNGTAHIPNGTVTIPNGTTRVPNGTIPISNGTKPISNGAIPVPNGTTHLIKVPTGTANGTAYIPSTSRPRPSSHPPLTRVSNNQLQPNGPNFLPVKLSPSNPTAYVTSKPPTSTYKSYYIPQNPDPEAGPKFQHTSPPKVPFNKPLQSNRYISDGDHRYVLDERPRVLVPLRKTRSYDGDHYRMMYDYEDDRRRRKSRWRRARKTQSLGHRFVYLAPPVPSPDMPRKRRRRRRRSHPGHTSSLRLARHPDRDYTLPRELRRQFSHQISQPILESSDTSGTRTRRRRRDLEHLNLETRRSQEQRTYRQSYHAPVSTSTYLPVPVNYDVPPPPSVTPPPPPTNQPPPPPPPPTNEPEPIPTSNYD